MLILLIIESLFLIAYLWYIIHSHASKTVSYYVKTLTLISWLISFSLIIILPLDIYQNINQQSGEAMEIIWTTLYWLTFVLTWFFLPLTLDYESAGEFTFKQKIIKSIKINLIIYGFGLLAGIIFTIVLLVKEQFTFYSLIAFVVVLSNGFGLIIVTFILGWAMVAIPKQFYRESNHQIQLSNKYFWIARSKNTLNQQLMDQEDLLIQILSYQSKYKNNEEFKPYINTILSIYTEEQIETARQLRNRGQQGVLLLEDLNVEKLAAIHKEAKELQLDCTRTQKKNELLIDQALFIEDIIHCDGNIIISGIRPQRDGCLGNLLDKLQYYWYVVWWKYIMYFMCGLFISIGLMVLVSDITIFIDQKYNPLSYVLKEGQEFWGVQLIILIPLMYVLYCVQYGMFSIRLNRYGFYDYGYTDGPSLIFAATFISRIAFPMAFNFFWIFAMNPADVANVVGDFSFDEYLKSFKLVLPCLLIVLIICNIFDIYDKLLGALGFARFQFEENYSDEHIEEGQEVVQVHRKELCQSLIQSLKQVEIKQPLL